MPLDVHRVLVCSKKSGRRKPVPKLGTQIGLEFQRDGALDRSDLEHTDIQNILEKLEEWEQVLHTDPLIREKLRDFDSSTSRDEIEVKPIQRPHIGGPSL